MEKLDSKIVELNNEKYLVYLKEVAVKSKESMPNTTIRAFVRKIQ